jgi:hypothetical protein
VLNRRHLTEVNAAPEGEALDLKTTRNSTPRCRFLDLSATKVKRLIRHAVGLIGEGVVMKLIFAQKGRAAIIQRHDFAGHERHDVRTKLPRWQVGAMAS